MVVVSKGVYKKYLKALTAQQDVCSDFAVPDNIEEFLRAIQIRSGGQIKPFELYQYQINLLELIEKYPLVTVVKSRQLGTTQCLIGWILYKAAQNPAYIASIFTRGDKDAGKLHERIKTLANAVGFERRKEIDEAFIFANNAEITLHNSAKEGNRSMDSVSTLFFDEMAFVPKIESIYSASTPSTTLVGKDARIINVSTPSAQSGLFWRLINEDNNTGKTVEEICKEVGELKLYSDNLPGWFWYEDFEGNCKVFIHWRCHPVYKENDNFVAEMQKKYQLSEEAAQREFNLLFLDPALQVFDIEYIRKCEVKFEFPIYATKKWGSRCEVGVYFSNTHFAIVVIKKGVVIDFHKENTLDAELIVEALMGCKNKHNLDIVVIKSFDGGNRIAKEIREITGARTVEIKRSEMADAAINLQLAIKQGAIVIPKYTTKRDPLIAKELRDFRRQGNKFCAVEGEHDEYVWALAFAVMAGEYQPKRLPFASGIKLHSARSPYGW